MLVPAPSVGSPIPIPVGDAQAPGSRPSSTNTAAIASAHIFGEASAEEASAPPVDNLEELEETNLRDLKLRGTMASERAEFSIAIIANNSNEEKVYVIGDPVAAGASLHAVYADRVVLDERGALTNLSLPKEFSQSRSSNFRAAIPTPEVSDNGDSIQAVVAQNVSRLADVIRPTPYFVNGEQQGYRVYPGRNRDQFAALGLRPGDLIKDIDGQSLTDPTQAMEIFQSLGTASQVSVTVERDGSPETIVLKTDQLDLDKEITQ
jgi:general secretion pathway protein C